MINVVVPIIDKAGEYEEFLNRISDRNTKIFVGVRKNLLPLIDLSRVKNVEVSVYSDNAKKEEILNALSENIVDSGKIAIVRRPLLIEEYQALVGTEYDIAYLKQNRNKFVSFFKKLNAKILRALFAFDYFDDISAICFNENMFELVCDSNNLSMASRINRYVGVTIEEIQTRQKAVKKETTAWKNNLKLLGWTLFMLASIASVTCLAIFTKTYPVVVMFEILWLIVAVTLWILGLVNYSRANAVGDLYFKTAYEIGQGGDDLSEESDLKNSEENEFDQIQKNKQILDDSEVEEFLNRQEKYVVEETEENSQNLKDNEEKSEVLIKEKPKTQNKTKSKKLVSAKKKVDITKEEPAKKTDTKADKKVKKSEEKKDVADVEKPKAKSVKKQPERTKNSAKTKVKEEVKKSTKTVDKSTNDTAKSKAKKPASNKKAETKTSKTATTKSSKTIKKKS